MKNLFYFLISICLLFANCGKNPITSTTSEVLLPLSLNNSWSYVVYTYMANSVIDGLTDSNMTIIIEQTNLLYDDQQHNVSVAAFFYPGNNTQPMDSKWLYWNGYDGLYVFGGISSHDTLINNILLLKFPVVKGETWRVPYLIYDVVLNRFFIDDTLEYSCVSVNEQLDTPSGSFRCFVYHHRIRPEEDVLEEWDYYEYYSPKIGKIGTIIKSSFDGSIKYKILLYQYTIS